MYKLENVNHSLLEFNYNAGIVGKTGKLTKQAEASQPFLVSDNVNNQYLGAAGMWTGSPYIVMGPDVQMNLINESFLTVPYLRFANLNNTQINKEMNRNIVNTMTLLVYLQNLQKNIRKQPKKKSKIPLPKYSNSIICQPITALSPKLHK